MVSKGETTGSKQGMRRIGNLFENVCSLENLQLADERSSKGKSVTIYLSDHGRYKKYYQVVAPQQNLYFLPLPHGHGEYTSVIFCASTDSAV